MFLWSEKQAQKVIQLAPSFAASLTKRLLEKPYDNVFKSWLGQWLVNLSPWKKHSIEGVLYVLTALLDDRLPENSILRKYAKEVVLDAAPEISKRMINGARKEISSLALGVNPLEKELLDAVLSLEDEDLAKLIQWFGRPDREQRKILAALSILSPEQLAKVFRLSAEEKEKFFEFFWPEKKPEEAQSLIQPEPAFGEVFRQDMVKGADWLNQTAERMRQKRKGGRS